MYRFTDTMYGTEMDIRDCDLEICKLCRHKYLRRGGCSNPDCDNYIPIPLSEEAIEARRRG